MPAYRSFRIQMPDRPGALSMVSTALAAHGVDIVRLDVVSHEGSLVVDDLFVAAESQEMIGAAVASFHSDVTVRTFETVGGDSVQFMASALGSVAAAPSPYEAAADGARVLGRADVTAVLRANGDGGFDALAGPVGLPAIASGEPFAGWWSLQRKAAIAFPAATGWAPLAFQHALSSAWLMLVPVGAIDLLVCGRTLNIAFYTEELERMQSYADALASIVAVRGDAPPAASLPAGPQTTLPARAISLGGRVTAW